MTEASISHQPAEGAPIRVYAPPKVNLTLEILGKRPDGYHELHSLVVFARSGGDWLTYTSGSDTAVEINGPFGSRIAGPNTLDRTLALVASVAPNLPLGRVALEKHIPVASGIGGGSTDAAALMKALALAEPAGTRHVDWPTLARTIGADVTVCLVARAAYMTGIGEVVTPLLEFPPLAGLLVSPPADAPADKTAQVFHELAAPPLQHDTRSPSLEAEFLNFDQVLSFLACHPNNLNPAAARLFPVMDQVLAEIAATPGCRIARSSGAGPTCFGLYETIAEAHAAAAVLAVRHPAWWITPTVLS